MEEGGENFVISKRVVYAGVGLYLVATVVMVASLPWLERQVCRLGSDISAAQFDPVSQPAEHLLAGNARFGCELVRGMRRELLRPLANVAVNIRPILKAQETHPLRDQLGRHMLQIMSNLETAAANATRRET